MPKEQQFAYGFLGNIPALPLPRPTPVGLASAVRYDVRQRSTLRKCFEVFGDRLKAAFPGLFGVGGGVPGHHNVRQLMKGKLRSAHPSARGRRIFVPDVDRRAANAVLGEGRIECRLVDGRPAAHIDDDGARLHDRKPLRLHHAAGSWRQRTAHHQKIRSCGKVPPILVAIGAMKSMGTVALARPVKLPSPLSTKLAVATEIPLG
jgi:hypothetical protein